MTFLGAGETDIECLEITSRTPQIDEPTSGFQTKLISIDRKNSTCLCRNSTKMTLGSHPTFTSCHQAGARSETACAHLDLLSLTHAHLLLLFSDESLRQFSRATADSGGGGASHRFLRANHRSVVLPSLRRRRQTQFSPETNQYRTVSCIRRTFLTQNETSEEGVRLINECEFSLL